MSQQGVKKLIGRLIADDKFRTAFHADPKEAAEDSGYRLNDQELLAVSKLKPNDLLVNIKHGPGTVASYEIDVRSAKI
jgi:hypothetical protein